jgi:hypothetical protein
VARPATIEQRQKYEAAIKEAKRNYFLELLAPYVADGVLDTRALKAKNPKLYEEARRGYGGIRNVCAELNFFLSIAAKKQAEKEDAANDHRPT